MNASTLYKPRRAARQLRVARHKVRMSWPDWTIALKVGLTGVAVVVACLTIWAVAQAQPARSAGGPAPIATVVVRPGDSLWSIAKRVGGEARDPRTVIEEIRAMNGIMGSSIWPGQELLVPAGV